MLVQYGTKKEAKSIDLCVGEQIVWMGDATLNLVAGVFLGVGTNVYTHRTFLMVERAVRLRTTIAYENEQLLCFDPKGFAYHGKTTFTANRIASIDAGKEALERLVRVGVPEYQEWFRENNFREDPLKQVSKAIISIGNLPSYLYDKQKTTREPPFHRDVHHWLHTTPYQRHLHKLNK